MSLETANRYIQGKENVAIAIARYREMIPPTTPTSASDGCADRCRRPGDWSNAI